MSIHFLDEVIARTQLRNSIKLETIAMQDRSVSGNYSNRGGELLWGIARFSAVSTSGKLELQRGLRTSHCDKGPDSLNPTGIFYVIESNPLEFPPLVELQKGHALEGSLVTGRHSVLTSLERSRWTNSTSLTVTTSHGELDSMRLSSTYSNNFCGGESVDLQLSQGPQPACAISASLRANSLSDPTMEVQLQQEVGSSKVSKSLVTNLRSGRSNFRLERREVWGEGNSATATLSSNFTEEHLLGLKLSGALSDSVSYSHSCEGKFKFVDGPVPRSKSTAEVSVGGKDDSSLRIKASASCSDEARGRLRFELQKKVLWQCNFSLCATWCADCPPVPRLQVGHKGNALRWQASLSHERQRGMLCNVVWRRQLEGNHHVSMKASLQDRSTTLRLEMSLPVS